MIETAALLHTGTLAGTLIMSIIGVILGQTRISKATLDAGNIQPQAQKDITKIGTIALAVTETACILALTVIIVLFLNTKFTPEYGLYTSIAQCGSIFALGISGLIVGLAAAKPASAAIYAVARQPFFTNQIMNLMIITMSLMQTPIIFGFIIQMLIHLQVASATCMENALKLFTASLCIGLGSIGPALGQGIFALSACQALGINRSAYTRIRTFALISQTLIETPILFAFIIALLIINSTSIQTLKVIALLGASLCVGICNTAAGISSGKTSATAANQIGLNHSHAAAISQTCLLAQGFIDSLAIYGFLVSILLVTN